MQTVCHQGADSLPLQRTSGDCSGWISRALVRGQGDGDWIYGGNVLAAVGPCLYTSSGGNRAHDARSLACSPMAVGVVAFAVPGARRQLI